jgi:protoporphyrinogen IX oxidase
MLLSYIKAIHIIFVVTWFAGLFYIVRLFIYHVEAEQREEQEKNILQKQFALMEKRLWYGITWPSMIGTLGTGTWLALLYGSLSSWLVLKLCFVAGLAIYHFQCGRIYTIIQTQPKAYTSTYLRVWNEVATLFLVSIVFLVVLKNTFSFLWGIAGLVAFAGLLLVAIRIYRNIREKQA